MASVRSDHYVVTLSGSAEALTPPGRLGDARIRWVSLQPGAANSNPVYVGGPAVSATVYGTRLPAASGGIPPAPHVIAEFEDGAVQMADFYVIGTAAEKLHVHVLVYA
jgi:hypothetical protein